MQCTTVQRRQFSLSAGLYAIFKVSMQTIAPLWLWITFVAIVLVSLFVDFVVLKKQGAHEIGVSGRGARGRW